MLRLDRSTPRRRRGALLAAAPFRVTRIRSPSRLRTGERESRDWTIKLLACLSSLTLGAAVAFADSPQRLAVPVGATVVFFITALIAAREPRASASPKESTLSTDLGYACLLIGAILITFNGIRAVVVTFDGVHVVQNAAMADVFLSAAAVMLLFGLLIGRIRRVWIPLWLGIPAVGLLACGVVSANGTQAFLPNAVPALRFVAALALTPLIFGLLTQSAKRRKWVLFAWLSSAAISASVAVLDGLGGMSIGSSLTGSEFIGREAGLTTHPNHLGLSCALGLPVALHLLQSADSSRGQRLFACALLPLLSIGLILSGSRAAVFSAVAGVGIALLMVRDTRHRVIAIVSLAAVAAVSVWILSASGSQSATLIKSRIGGDASTVASDADRKLLFEKGVHGFLEKPIVGQGFQEARSAHNIYLQLLESGGILAFAAFAVFALGVLRLGIRLRGDVMLSRAGQGLAAALTATVGTWLVAGLAENALYDRYLYVAVGLLLGLAAEAALRRRADSLGDAINGASPHEGGEAGRRESPLLSPV